jgi:hypothetical protein
MAPPTPVSSPEIRIWSGPSKSLSEMADLPREEKIQLLLADARRRAEERGYEPGTIIARVGDFTEEELASLDAKFIVRGGYVFLTECSTYGHDLFARRIGLAQCVSDVLDILLDEHRIEPEVRVGL